MDNNEQNIRLNPTDPASLKSAIESYILRIETETIGVGEEMTHCFMKGTEDEPVYLSNQDVMNRELMVKLLSVWEMLDLDQYTGDEEEPLFSEIVVAVNALQFPELKGTMVKWAETIVRISRKHNDTSDLWVDCMHVFGLDTLYAIALTYPEYMYFIGLYLIPYWDDEHAHYAYQYLPMLQSQFGYSRDLLKTIAFCDNEEAVSQVIVEEDYISNHVEKPLYKHLLAHPDDYTWFAECLVEKFHLYPVAPEDENGIHMAEVWIRHIVPAMSQEDWETKQFISDTFENEVANLSQRIDQVLEDIPESDYWFKDKDDDVEDENKSNEQPKQRWEAFCELCEKGFDNGEQVLNYVLEGTQPEVLDTIPMANLFELVKERDLLGLSEAFYINRGDNLSWFVSDYLEALDEYLPTFLSQFRGSKTKKSKGIMLRGLDVLFRIHGKRSFGPEIDLEEELVEIYELLTKEELNLRFKGDKEAEIRDALKKHLKQKRSRRMTREKLEKIYQLYKQKPEIWNDLLQGIQVSEYDDTSILEEVDQLTGTQSQQLVGTGVQLLNVAYICWREKAHRSDPMLAPLVSFFTNSFWKRLLYDLLENQRIVDEKEKENFLVLLKDLFEYGNGMRAAEGQKEAILKMVKEGKDALSEEELRLIHQKPKATKSKEEINDRLKSFFHKKEENQWLGIPEVELFDSWHMNGILAATMFGFRSLSVEMENGLLRAFHLILDLAPVKTLHTVAKLYLADDDEFSLKEYYELLELFQQMHVPEDYLKAWQIVYFQKHLQWDKSLVWDDYSKLLELYHTRHTINEQQINLHVTVEKREKAGMLDMMQYLDHKHRRLFIENLNEQYPEQVYQEHLRQEFLKDLKQFIGEVVRKEGMGNWHYNTDTERAEHARFVKEMTAHLESFVFQNGLFEPIETGLLPYLDEDIPCTIDDSLWYLPEQYRHRVLYFHGRMNYMDGVYAYWEDWEEKNNNISLNDMFELLLEVGLGRSFALRFLLENFPDDYLEPRNQDDFIEQYHRIYDRSSIMIDEYQSINPSLVVKAVRWMGTDLMNSPFLLQFFAHRSRKVRDEAIKQLLTMPHISLGFRNPFMIQFFQNHPGKAREWFYLYIQKVRADFPAEKVGTHCDEWQKLLDKMEKTIN
ncbi:hypothetical protein DMA11_12075 [Marinilabiliaceae bacterium JC017]|nr:hypothetical protein DMA11_12075 [Marinilabiliaceae bacterium JC017]